MHVPLVAPRYRGIAVAVALLGAGTTALLGLRYAGERRPGQVDRVVTDLVDMREGVVKTVGQGLAHLGGPFPVLVALILVAVLAGRWRGGRGLALVLLGPPSAMVTTSLVLKPLIARTKGDELAYPSGHTTSVASLAVACAVLVLGLAAWPIVVRAVLVLALGGLVVAVGTSLVGRGYHYPTDTVGAVGVALAVVLVVSLLVDAVGDLVADPGRDPEAGPGPTDRPTQVLPRARA